MKGQRVAANFRNSGIQYGKVVAESEECVGVVFDNTPEVPQIVKKVLVRVVLT